MKFVIIAGPQSSGKTTSLNYLRDKHSERLDFHPEINQNTLFPERARLGSIAVTAELETEIIQADTDYIRSISDSSRLQLAETSLFHLVYSHHLAPEIYHSVEDLYRQALSPHELYIIFIDTLPEICFARREHIYQERVKDKSYSEQQELMLQYEKRIRDLYPVWHQVLKEVDYAREKIIISNNHSDRAKFLSDVDREFLKILS